MIRRSSDFGRWLGWSMSSPSRWTAIGLAIVGRRGDAGAVERLQPLGVGHRDVEAARDVPRDVNAADGDRVDMDQPPAARRRRPSSSRRRNRPPRRRVRPRRRPASRGPRRRASRPSPRPADGSARRPASDCAPRPGRRRRHAGRRRAPRRSCPSDRARRACASSEKPVGSACRTVRPGCALRAEAASSTRCMSCSETVLAAQRDSWR